MPREPGRRRVQRLALVADRLWRYPLCIAAALFLLSGPAHALGRTDAVFYASLVGLAGAAGAVLLGFLSLPNHPSSEDTE